MTGIWPHVTRQTRCPVCGRPDWCQLGKFAVKCMRVESAKPCKSGGWYHKYAEQAPVFRPTLPPPGINATAMLLKWAENTPAAALGKLATSLGVSDDSLASLNAAWASQHRAWAFPMRDGYNNIVGIRLRAEDGRKWAVRGSRSGIFWPATDPQPDVFVTEGPTDTAAALTLGLFALGRPNCNTGGTELRQACRQLSIRRVVMVSDNDDPGVNGADRIAKEIALPHCFWCPPAKDIRDFLQLGGTRLLIEDSLKGMKWTN